MQTPCDNVEEANNIDCEEDRGKRSSTQSQLSSKFQVFITKLFSKLFKLEKSKKNAEAITLSKSPLSHVKQTIFYKKVGLPTFSLSAFVLIKICVFQAMQME